MDDHYIAWRARDAGWFAENVARADMMLAAFGNGSMSAKGVRGGIELNDTTGQVDHWADYRATHAQLLSEVEAEITNSTLMAAYQRTSGEEGDAEADALLAEIERRGLDV